VNRGDRLILPAAWPARSEKRADRRGLWLRRSGRKPNLIDGIVAGPGGNIHRDFRTTRRAGAVPPKRLALIQSKAVPQLCGALGHAVGTETISA